MLGLLRKYIATMLHEQADELSVNSCRDVAFQPSKTSVTLIPSALCFRISDSVETLY